MLIDIFKHHQVDIFFYEALNKQLQPPVDDILTNLDKIHPQDQLFFLWHDYLNMIGDMPSKLYDYLAKNNIEPIIDATHSLPTKGYQALIVVFGFRKLLNEPFGAFVKLNSNITTVTTTSSPLLKLCLILLVYRIKATLLFIFKFFN